MDNLLKTINYRLNILVDEGFVSPDQLSQNTDDISFFERWMGILWTGRKKKLHKAINQRAIQIELGYMEATRNHQLSEQPKRYTDQELDAFMQQQYGYAIKPIKTPKEIRDEKNR